MFAWLQVPSPHLSSPHKAFERQLDNELDGLAFVDDEYRVFGGRCNEGAVVVSRSANPVDPAPIDDGEQAVRAVTSYRQAIGIHPESPKETLPDDRLASPSWV